MDAGTLGKLMGNSLPIGEYSRLLPAFMSAAARAGITDNRARMAMWCAQLGHESGGLRWLEEIADGSAYEGRADLGNVRTGDGRRFKGRGAIQLTGRDNYRAFTQWAMTQGYTTIDFEAHPERVADPEWGFLAVTWYWTVRRPQLNILADRGDLEGCTRLINGGLNGLADRRERYRRALKILEGATSVAKTLNFSRDRITQETGWYCGPASTQTVLAAAMGRFIEENVLAGELRTTRNGTDYIGQFPAVLNKYLPGAGYQIRNLVNYPNAEMRDVVWADITGSIDAGRGVVANIVAPPSNYPRAVWPSTQAPQYGGGTVYHYVAVMGYAGDGADRRVLVADSGFRPYEYWLSFDQFCTLVPPKGYCYAAKKDIGGSDMADTVLLNEIHRLTKETWEQLRGRGGSGWPQLGKNAKGENLTPVDGLAAIRLESHASLSEIMGVLSSVQEQVTALTKIVQGAGCTGGKVMK